MKSRYRLTKHRPIVVLLLIVFVVAMAGFYGCNHSLISGWIDKAQKTLSFGQKSESEITREKELASARQKGLLILVNKQHPLEENYKPEDLTAIKYFVDNRPASARFMRAEAAEAFHLMVESAAKDGIEIKMTTAYRSYAYQKTLFESYVSLYGEAEASRFSAKPGQSEHQTGLAVDVSSPSVNYQLSDSFGETEEGMWLAAHAQEFGFIIRYPSGKEEITGYSAEPWHLRYVGNYVAKEIFGKDITLEEYLKQQGIE